MLQRTGIAAAILHWPRLVILDEPMNGLDPLGRREFRDLLHSLKSEGCTVFLSSHVLADIESTADRVGILDQGRLVRCGPLDEILSRGERGVEIAFELPSAVGLDSVASRFESLRESGRGWIATAANSEAGMEAVRRILEGGGRLHSFQRCRVSLEDFFVRHVSTPRSHDSLGPARAEPARSSRASDRETEPHAATPTSSETEEVKR
jgi:ABC-2 type transport system ATP-binding protein